MIPRIAILVDGENIPARHARAILGHGATLGDPVLRRVYGNTARIRCWTEAPSFHVIHTGDGRNGADLALAIDAVDLRRSDAFDAALLVSSDGDFRHLATWLRERGARVTGMGTAQASAAFRAACHAFHDLPAPPAPVTIPDNPEAQVAAILKERGGKILLTHLNAEMKRRYGTHVSDLPGRNWRAWLIAHPARFALDPQGTDAKVSLR